METIWQNIKLNLSMLKKSLNFYESLKISLSIIKIANYLKQYTL